MAKKKKTKEQKIIAEIRRRQQLSAQKVYTLAADKSILSNEKQVAERINKTPTQFTTATINHYNYLVHDLKKTIFLTAGIIILQLFLYFIVKL